MRKSKSVRVSEPHRFREIRPPGLKGAAAGFPPLYPIETIENKLFIEATGVEPSPNRSQGPNDRGSLLHAGRHISSGDTHCHAGDRLVPTRSRQPGVRHK